MEGDEPDEEPAAPAAAAPAAAAAGERSRGSGEEGRPAADRSQREWNKGRRSPSPQPLGGVRDLREMLSRRPSGGARGSDGGAAAAAAAGGRGEREGGELPPGLGVRVGAGGERREGGRGGEVRERERERRREEPHPVRTLDELFRKTAAKPCIYWLPLTGARRVQRGGRCRPRCWRRTDGAAPPSHYQCWPPFLCSPASPFSLHLLRAAADQQVADKKRKAEEEAAAKAAGGGSEGAAAARKENGAGAP